jgi:hypothetical protein
MVCLPLVSDREGDRGLAAGLADGSRRASWLLLIGGMGALSAGLDTLAAVPAFLANMAAAWRGIPEPPFSADAWSLAAAGVTALTALLLWGRLDWEPLESAAERPLGAGFRLLALLTLGSWLAWPLEPAQRVASLATTEDLTLLGQVVLAALVVLGVAWLYRYRPTVPAED